MAKRRERERVSGRGRAQKRAASSSGFEGSSIRVPEGWRLFEVKKDRIRMSFACYRVGKGNPYADEGKIHFERTYFVHKNVGAEGKQYVCPKKTFGKRCPICEDANRLRNDPNADKDLVKNLWPKERQLWITRDEDGDDGWQIWDFSYHLFGKQLDDYINNSDEDEDVNMFADFEEGQILRVSFAEESFGGNSFRKATSIAFKPRPAIDPDEIDNMPCLDDLLVEIPYKKLEAIYLQIDDTDAGDDDEDEDEKPQAKKSSVKPKPKANDDDWDDEEEKPKAKAKKPEPEDDGDEEEEEKPKAKSQAKAKSQDDDWDDDEEEEKPQPVKKKRGRPPKVKQPEPEPQDDDWDDDEEEEEEKPKSKSKASSKPKKSDDDDDDDWDDFD